MVEFKCLCCRQMKQLQHVSVNESETESNDERDERNVLYKAVRQMNLRIKATSKGNGL